MIASENKVWVIAHYPKVREKKEADTMLLLKPRNFRLCTGTETFAKEPKQAKFFQVETKKNTAFSDVANT